jgi:hypothetical protein
MADIDVVKKGSRTWIWIVVAIALALILWFVMAGTGARETGSLLHGEGLLHAGGGSHNVARGHA